MWIQTDVNKSQYEPELINIETGARIYYEYEYDENMNCEIDNLMYEHPSLDVRIILKKNIVYNRQEDNNSAPFADEIDSIYEALKKGEKVFDFELE